MKWIKVGVIVLAFLVVLVAGGILYLLYTTSGAHLIFGGISRLTSAKISAADLQGYLARQVSVSGLKIRLPETTITAERLILSCAPSSLLLGRLDLRKLKGKDVKIVSTGPEKKEPISFIPPHVPRFIAALKGRIREFAMQGLSYGAASDGLMFINQIKGRAEWYRGILSVRDLVIGAPAGQISGRVDVGFYRPLLASELWIDTKEDRANLNRLLIRSNLRPAFARTGMTGTINAWAYRDTESRVALVARLSASRHALDIRNLTITRPGEEGSIKMHGRIATNKAPSFAVEAEMDRFALAGLAPATAVLTGSLNVAGTPDVYEGRFVFSNAAQDWRAFKMSGQLRGDRRQAITEIPKGEWLDGDIAASITINWEKDVQMTGNLKARGLKTELVDKTWPGTINSDAAFRLHRSASGATVAALDARLLNSTFRQRAVKGDIEAAYQNGILRVADLTLQGKGFEFFAEGSLAERINFNANIQDFSSIVPGMKGVLTGGGWVRYLKSDLTMSLSTTGKTIQYERLRIGRIDLGANIDQTGTRNLRIEANGQSISYAGADLSSLRAAINGKASSHEIHLRAIGPAEQMQASAIGSYEKGTWKGSLKELRGSDRQRGGWFLEGPASLTFSRKQIYVAPLVVQGAKGESISGGVDLRLKPTNGFIKAEWQNLDLSRLDPITPLSLHMRANGHVFLQWTKGTLDRLNGETASPVGQLVYRGCPVGISRIQGAIDWTQKGLKGTGQVVLTEGGGFRSDISSALRPRIGLPEQGRFSAMWNGFRLVTLNPFLPASTRLDGMMSGRAEGRLLPKKAFALDTFNSRFSEALLTQRKSGEIIKVSIPEALIEGGWSERNLNGRLRLNAGSTGSTEADFVLPIPASLPLKVVSSGPVSLNAKAYVRDMKPTEIFLPEGVQKPEGRMEITASAAGTWERPILGGALTLQDAGVYLPAQKIKVQGARADGRLSWSGQGLAASLDARLKEEGLVQASAISTEAPRMGLPETANLSARWKNLNLGLIEPLLPVGMQLSGQTVGSIDGKLLPGRKISATVDTKVGQGDFSWRTERGLARAAFREVSLQATWSGEDVRGMMNLELAKQGQLQGSFLLPIPARLPVQAVYRAPLAVRLDGQVQEEGMLSAFFPGLVQETKGSIIINAQAMGTWDQPRFTGAAQLSNAGAYLPTAGITIKAVRANITLSESSINIQEFHAESGPGRIDGSGVVSLRAGQIEKFTGKLAGDRFQAIHLPDLRLLVSPSLNISGTGKSVFMDGEIDVPRLLVYGPPTEDVVRASPDVVIIGAKETQKRKFPIELQAKVRVVLGNDVRIKMQGIDAKLDGEVLLNINDIEDIRGTGEIRIVKGQYQAYGVELQVARGKMSFAGGPLERGELDILAVRKIEGVVRLAQMPGLLASSPTKTARPSGAAASTTTETQTVGVQVAGTLQKPRISLYSNPPLSDSDTLSYMVLGRPVSGNAAQASLLFNAAGTLLGGTGGGSVQEQIKKTLGLEDLEIGTETVATEQGQVEQTMVRVGRYLAPNLYIGFGRSLFADEYVVTARYNLSKRWEIQTRTGTQTGGDIYYKVEFD
jgi:autotransporter translocation and assembly factor TamB